MPKQLYRLPEQGKIAGVTAGLGHYFDIDPTIIRLLFVAAAFITSGWAVVLYLALAVVLPAEGHTEMDISERFNELVKSTSVDRTRNWFGFGLILIGAWYLIGNLWPHWLSVSGDILLPLALVTVGLLILTKGGGSSVIATTGKTKDENAIGNTPAQEQNSWAASNILWGGLFLLTGTLLLMSNLGIVNVQWAEAWRLWPVLIILAGLSHVIVARLGSRSCV